MQIVISELKVKCVLGCCIMPVLFGVFGVQVRDWKWIWKVKILFWNLSGIFFHPTREKGNTVWIKAWFGFRIFIFLKTAIVMFCFVFLKFGWKYCVYDIRLLCEVQINSDNFFWNQGWRVIIISAVKLIFD